LVWFGFHFVTPGKQLGFLSIDRIPKMILKYQPKGKIDLGRPLKKMEGFSFVTPVTGLNRPNTGEEEEEDANLVLFCLKRVLDLLSEFC
jgi:hypothetical protein